MANGRAWTTDDTAALQNLVAAGWPDGHIASAMGRHGKFIGLKRREFGIGPGQSGQHTAMMARIKSRRARR